MNWNLTNGNARRVSLAAVSMALALGACTTMGTGSGSTVQGDNPVSFSWTSKDGGVTGTMTATTSNGGVFTGPYLEITGTAQTQSFAPMWTGWAPGWRDWGPYGFGGLGYDATTTTYSGKAVANLMGPGSQRMRCNFNLNDPQSGMSGGGQGKCQIAGGATVDAVFGRGTSRMTRSN
jgi:hypothetical protein